MNYYERIQQSIDYMESRLYDELPLEECAREAYMSLSGYYRMFLSITGYTVKEYIRLRRLTLALADLQDKAVSILTIATTYCYNSADSFSRAFRKQFGLLPSQVRTDINPIQLNTFERMNLMEKFFETENNELVEKYPDIKVIRSLEEQKVACFTYFGPNPEDHAFDAMKDYVKRNNISLADDAYRIYGYNNPDPSNPEDPDELYGYEVCVTITDDLYNELPDVPKNFVLGTTYPCVVRKTLQGGKYAVLSVKRDENGDVGTNIMHAWQRFSRWMEEGKYIWAGRQYLEEHLGFNEEDEHIGGVDLYMPIETAPTNFNEREERTVAPCRVAVFRAEDNDCEKAATECWGQALAFAKENHLDAEQCKLYHYNKGFSRKPPFFNVIMITLPEEFTADNSTQVETFNGGTYMTIVTDFEQLGAGWMSMEKWRKDHKIKASKLQWFEEWTMTNWDFPAKAIRIHYPIG